MKLVTVCSHRASHRLTHSLHASLISCCVQSAPRSKSYQRQLTTRCFSCCMSCLTLAAMWWCSSLCPLSSQVPAFRLLGCCLSTNLMLAFQPLGCCPLYLLKSLPSDHRHAARAQVVNNVVKKFFSHFCYSFQGFFHFFLIFLGFFVLDIFLPSNLLPVGSCDAALL